MRAGGEASGSAVREARAWATSVGLGALTDVVAGPLPRSTHGNLLSHMPLVPDSTYTHLMGALKMAWDVSRQMEEPDMELDLNGLDAPKWGHHTLRRTSDKSQWPR